MDDLISRQAVIDAFAIGEELLKSALDQMYVVGNAREKYEFGIGLIKSYIADVKELPSAQPERKPGKWALNKEGNWSCPFCEFDPYHDNMKGMNYCPNCGARLNMPLRREYDDEVH